MKTILTHTGKIYVDTEHKLEFLTVGDYGKENNIKANFLGLTKEINGVANTEVNLSKKWVATISTQKGCPMNCKFCDVPKFGFYGNASIEDMERQIRTIIENESVRYTERFNVHFARMGEPTWNQDVLAFGIALKGVVRRCGLRADTVHPVVSTMLPRANTKLENFLHVWCSIKNDLYGGEAGLQLSINSTSDKQRLELFDSRSLSLSAISKIADKLPMPKGRKYTLNFPVTAQTILDAKELTSLFDKDKFIVKITPIHETASAIENGFEVTGYSDYNVYRMFEQPLLEEGWDVIVFVPSKEEDSDRITCVNSRRTYLTIIN
jgi:23S rRNA (adenine2503-C2)-methyltransferase